MGLNCPTVSGAGKHVRGPMISSQPLPKQIRDALGTVASCCTLWPFPLLSVRRTQLPVGSTGAAIADHSGYWLKHLARVADGSHSHNSPRHMVLEQGAGGWAVCNSSPADRAFALARGVHCTAPGHGRCLFHSLAALTAKANARQTALSEASRHWGKG